MVTGEELKARRYAREVVAEMRWSGMTVPPLYARMASEFQDLVRSGDYAAWVAAKQTSAPMARATPGAKWTAAPHAAWRGLPLPGPVPGR